jgi:class 3 adenylate cyclase
VGDTVNLAQRLQDLARPGNRTVVSQATWSLLPEPPSPALALDPTLVKGRETPVAGWIVEG